MGEYLYELRDELEVEEVLEKVTSLMNREYEGKQFLDTKLLYSSSECPVAIVPRKLSLLNTVYSRKLLFVWWR